ncbi:MAG TPA: hypothetical protein VFG69_12485 [Nannocystaceae bacterium]|nr:hypothetical protein [Nannocystaceae bacterium]
MDRRVQRLVSLAPLLLGCPRAAEPVGPTSVPTRTVDAPVAAIPDAPASGWWCFTGRFPQAKRTTSRCVRDEGECNGRLAERKDEGYTAETPQCFRLERAQCTAFPSGAELCLASPSHCEATRKVFSGRPGDPKGGKVPACAERP